MAVENRIASVDTALQQSQYKWHIVKHITSVNYTNIKVRKAKIWDLEHNTSKTGCSYGSVRKKKNNLIRRLEGNSKSTNRSDANESNLKLPKDMLRSVEDLTEGGLTTLVKKINS